MSKDWRKCPSDEHRTDSQKKPSSLSSTILDYYNKYGQNRDLEKYLRFRRCGRSSSDESGSIHISPASGPGVSSKSLENLHILHSNLEVDKSVQKSRSNESLGKRSRTETSPLSGRISGQEATKSTRKIDVPDETEAVPKPDEVKVLIKNAQKSKNKKSFNFNMESNIEISFPQPIPPNTVQQYHQQLPQIMLPIETAPQKITVEHSETQTDAGILEFPKTPMRPLEKQIDFDLTPQVEAPRPISAASSAASVSNKQRLEWDSMADVGYDKSIDPTSKSLVSTLTSFERSALKKFFAERGLSFDENMVVFGTKKAVSEERTTGEPIQVSPIASTSYSKDFPPRLTKDKWENAFRKILEEKHAEAVGRSKSEPDIGNGKRLWESALKKFRKKYGTRFNESDLCITKPEIHSTPIAEPMPVKNSKGAIPKTTKFIQQKVATEAEQAKLTEKIELLDKSCQTSLVSLVSKECQAEKHFSKGTSSDDNKTDSSSDHIPDDTKSSRYLSKGVVSATSFEFLSASAYEKGLPSKNGVNQVEAQENKENLPPDDEKENIPPPIVPVLDLQNRKSSKSIENKENIPPPRELSQAEELALNRNADDIVDSILSTTRSEEMSSSTVLSSSNSFFGSSVNAEQDLQKGIDILNALVESNNMDKPTKKKLIKKVVQRLVKAKFGDTSNKSMESTKNSTAPTQHTSDSSTNHTSSSSEIVTKNRSNVTVSGVNTLSSSETSKQSELLPIPEHPKPVSDKATQRTPRNNDDNTMRDWLQPLTHSELDFKQHQQILATEKQQQNNAEEQIKTDMKLRAIDAKQQEMATRLLDAQANFLSTKGSASNVVQPNTDGLDEHVLQFVSQERNTQLDWIQKEINHLVNLKEFLMGEKKKREMEIMKTIINLDGDDRRKATSSLSGSAGVSVVEPVKSDEVGRRDSKMIIYENMKERNGSRMSSRSGYAESTARSGADGVGVTAGNSSSNTTSDSPAVPLVSLPSKPGGQVPPRKSSYFKEKPTQRISASKNRRSEIDTPSDDWNSHKNMQQIARNRTKLETPNDIDSYELAKQQAFIEKYQSLRPKMYEDRLIYTQPYSTDHYSEPREKGRKLSSKKATNDAYTSITSSDLFLSSRSVSIPGANSTSNTTTHQYDTHTSVAIQTSDSLRKTNPIFGTKADGEPTRRVASIKHNKQQQVLPAAVAYVLTFDDQAPKPNPLIQKQSAKPYLAAGSSNNDRIGNDDESSTAVPKLTLHEQLKTGRPSFLSKAEERRKCVNEIHNLRQKRNEQRQKLLLLSSTNTSLRSNLRYLNPPPITLRRVFTTKGLKKANNERYKQLPEVRRKEEIERKNKIKRSNRIVTDMFNRDLQRRVLKGKINLSNSMTVMQ